MPKQTPAEKIDAARKLDVEIAREFLADPKIAAHPDEFLNQWAKRVIENEQEAIAKGSGK